MFKKRVKPCLLFLTCKDKNEADKISLLLLNKKLVVCVKKVPINSSYLWKNRIESAKEVLLIMDSIEENFEKVNQEVKKIHSYKTYTLLGTKVNQINKEAFDWIKECVGERT